MSFRIEPQGRTSAVNIYSERYLGEHFLHFQCFENFLDYGLRSEVYEWRGGGQSAEYSLENPGKKRGKARLDVRLSSENDGVRIDTSVTNLDTHIIEDVKYNACLQSKHVPFFRDTEGERVHVWTSEGWRPVASLPCRVGPKNYRRMQNYFVKDHEPNELVDGFMGNWGFCPTPLAKAFIARTSSESALAMGFMWDRAFYCRTNMNDSHHCMHSQGQIDDLPPGQTRTRTGKIFFAESGLDEVYEMARRFFGWRE
jgi:hypothetical protein